MNICFGRKRDDLALYEVPRSSAVTLKVLEYAI